MRKQCCFWMLALLLFAALLTGCGGQQGETEPSQDTTAAETAPETVHPPAESCTPEDTGFCFYRSQLSPEQQALYDQIAAGIEAQVPELAALSPDKEEIFAAAKAVHRDHPEFFWFEGAGKVETTFVGEQPASAVYRPEYSMSADMRASYQEIVDQWTADCLAVIPADASDYDKILAVYRYIIDHTDYRDVANNSIVNVMAGGGGKCGCYAMTTQYLLNRLGVDCTYVIGTAKGEDHAWNLVWPDGTPCWLDTTWGDPVFTEGGIKDGIFYDYFCVTTADLLRTHTPESGLTLPDCTCGDYNYYRRNGLYFETYDREALVDPVEQAVSRGEKQISLRFSDSVYWEAREALLNGQDIGLIFREVDSDLGTDFLSAPSFSCASSEAIGSITLVFPS